MSDYKLSPRQRREAEAVLESMVGGGGDPEPYAFEIVALRARVRELENLERWPSVLMFAAKMVERLDANAHKGGWSDCGSFWLHERLHDEWRELFTAIKDDGDIVGEAADVANFAMMIAANAALAGGGKEGDHA